VALRHPTYAFPVRDLATLMSHEPEVKGQRAGVIRDCISLKSGTTVERLYTLMLHHYRMVTGKFVRAEVRLDLWMGGKRSADAIALRYRTKLFAAVSSVVISIETDAVRPKFNALKSAEVPFEFVTFAVANNALLKFIISKAHQSLP